MTIVAGISIGGFPAFLGDLLISWKLKTKLSLPTQPTKEVYPGCGGNYAAGLAQKLIIIRPYLMLAWAGSASHVFDLVQKLDEILPRNFLGISKIQDLLSKYLEDLGGNAEVLCLIAHGRSPYPICVNTAGYIIENMRIYILGTGGPEFLSFVSSDDESKKLIDEQDGRLARAILVRFAAQDLMHQFGSGYDLSESWGGGFEIAYLKNRRFKKIDGLLCRAWCLGPEGELGSTPAMFLNHYEGNTFCITSISTDVITTEVRSWIKAGHRSLTYQKIVPEWIIDIIIDTRTGRILHCVRAIINRSKSKTFFIFFKKVC